MAGLAIKKKWMMREFTGLKANFKKVYANEDEDFNLLKLFKIINIS